ncbi:hypothetical protein ACWDAF_41840, partial [Streptomyces sp. NPDC001226]
PPTALQEQLATAAEYRRHAQWHRLSPLLEALTAPASGPWMRPGGGARASVTAAGPLVDGAQRRDRRP